MARRLQSQAGRSWTGGRLAVFLLAAAALPAQEYRAFWADAFHKGYKSPAEVDQLIDDLVKARANAVFPEVRRSGGSYYLKSLEPPVEDGETTQGFDALQYLIERAHANSIEVHAWFQVTPLWSSGRPPADSRHTWYKHGPNAPGDDMWMSVNPKGEKGPGLDPGNPGALRYLADVITDVARQYDVDGLHLDFIRYWPETDPLGWGWNPAAVARFQRLANAPGVPNAADPRWSDFRRRQVTALVRQIYLRSFAIRPRVKVSAALITWSTPPNTAADFPKTEAYWRVFQDWRAWLEEGIVDLGIPMNYIDNSGRYTAWFDRWTEFEKDNQYGRGILVGPGIYLNTIPDSMTQLQKALAPSAAGNRARGVNFYSYASTNKNQASPNSDFYGAAGAWFREPADVPDLPWKASPAAGHVYGWVYLNQGFAALGDGATVVVESDTGAPAARRVTTDGTGFFAAVDLPPDRYRVRVERAGVELYRAAAQDVRAGTAAAFEMFLKDSDFAAATPAIISVSKQGAAPGDTIVLTGLQFASGLFPAQAVPLPLELEHTQVLVNGTAAPLFSVSPNRIELQIPYLRDPVFTITVRRDGLESAPVPVNAVAAAPVITGVRTAGGYLEIYATGLGAVDPPLEAGLGAGVMEPLPRVTATVAVEITANGTTVTAPALYAGLQPYQPGRYQVNVQLPPVVTAGSVVIRVAGAPSNAVRF